MLTFNEKVAKTSYDHIQNNFVDTFSLSFKYFFFIFSKMGPKKAFSQRKPRKPQKKRSQPAVHVPEEIKIRILSLVNEKRYLNLLIS